jgi:inner membrane protein
MILNPESIISAWLIWFLLGIGLAFLELYMPGFIVLFFCVGCWIVAGTLLVFELTITQQLVVFIVSTITSIVLLRKLVIRIFRGFAVDQAHKDFDDFPAGVRVKVVQRITPKSNGRIHYRGSFWDATADDEIDEGEYVEIMRFAGNSRQVFFVKKFDNPLKNFSPEADKTGKS